jgi:hypothetical protein
VAGPARTLKDFIWLLGNSSLEVLEGHVRRGDFSRWTKNILRDNRLAAIVSDVEHKYQLGKILDLQSELTNRIRERFDFPAHFCPTVREADVGDAIQPPNRNVETQHASSPTVS